MQTPKVSLKLITDPKSNKVLFAESEKDFVDFLCTLLCLPLGAAINLLKESPIFGSIENLYNSIQNLKAVHMQPNHQKKYLLLKPCLPVHALNLPLTPSVIAPQRPVERKLYQCSDDEDCTNKQVTYCKNTRCSECGELMDDEATVVGKNSSNNVSYEGYVKGDIRYMVMDDLSVLPIVSIETCFDELRKMDVKNVAALQTQVVEVGAKEVVKLLKASLESKEVLTNVFLLKPSIKRQKSAQS